MIFNEHLDRLIEVGIVRDFMQQQRMQGKLCSHKDNYSFILYRLPYVIQFYDALIENYLEIWLFDLNNLLAIQGGSALGCSLDLNLQSLSELRQRDFLDHPQLDIFMSEHSEKMRYLHSYLEAISRLLPYIEAQGGLASLRDGTFDSRFDFSQSVQPMWPGKKESLLECLK